MTAETGRRAGLSPRSGIAVGAAAVAGGASGYLVLLVAAKTLSTERNAAFLVFWALLFWVFGAVNGVQNESTRAVGAAAADGGAGRGVRVVPASIALGAVIALLVAATSPLWGARVLGDDWPGLVAVVAVSALAFTGHSALTGALAGRGDWSAYAATVTGEAVVRLALVGVVAAVGAGVLGLEVAAGAGAAAWVVLAVVARRVRAGLGARADVPLPQLLRHVRATLLASVASSALLVGFPVLLSATATATEVAAAAPFFLAISLTRAPLIFPLIAYQGVAITHFLARRDQGLRALWPGARLLLGLGVVGTAAAWAVGPWLMRTLVGPEYDVPGGLLAALTAAAAVLALLTLTGAATLALGAHRAFAAGWTTAALVSVTLLLLPLPLETRGVLSLAAGPLVGVVVQLLAVARSSRGATSVEG